MVGVKIDLRVGGKPVKIQNEEDIRKLRSYLDDLLAWMSQAPDIDGKFPVSPYEESGQISMFDYVEQKPANGETRRRGPNPIIGERVIDYIVRALQVFEAVPRPFGEDPTVDDVYKIMQDLEWRSSSEPRKAKRVLMVTARNHKKLVTVDRAVHTNRYGKAAS